MHLPLQPDAAAVPGWPGSDLLRALAGTVGQGELDYTNVIPADDGWRQLDLATELGVVVRNVVLPIAT